MTEFRHPNSGDLYTPITPEVVALLGRMRDECGTWREVAALSDTRLKVLRNIRRSRKDRKAVSQKLLDRLCSATGVGGIHEFVWFTADDLVRLGLWKPVQYVEGRRRVVVMPDGEVVEVTRLEDDATEGAVLEKEGE